MNARQRRKLIREMKRRGFEFGDLAVSDDTDRRFARDDHAYATGRGIAAGRVRAYDLAKKYAGILRDQLQARRRGAHLSRQTVDSGVMAGSAVLVQYQGRKITGRGWVWSVQQVSP